jgi:hypothetical protein
VSCVDTKRSAHRHFGGEHEDEGRSQVGNNNRKMKLKETGPKRTKLISLRVRKWSGCSESGGELQVSLKLAEFLH